MLLYTVRCSPSIFARQTILLFDEKILCVRRRDHYLAANPAYRYSVLRKTCSQNMMNAFYTLFAVRLFLSFVIFSSFCPYFSVVRE